MILMKMIIGTIKTSSMKKTSRTSTRDNSKSGFGKMIRATVGRQKKVWPMSLMINKMQVVSFQQIQNLMIDSIKCMMMVMKVLMKMMMFHSFV